MLPAASAIHAQSAPLFFETDGIVVMEIESHPPVNGWNRETEHEGFTGESYVRDSGGGLMTFPVYISRPGTYRLQLHNRHDHPRTDLENDVFARMDDGAFIKCFSSAAHKWVWGGTLEYSGAQKVPPDYSLSAGLHKLQFRSRSPGFKIDRVALFLAEGDYKNKALDLSQPETRGIPDKPDLDKHPAVLAAWESGQLGSAMNRLLAATMDAKTEDDDQAKAAIDHLARYIQSRHTSFAAFKKDDPLGAAEALAFFADHFLKGCEKGKELAAEAETWRKEPAALQELAARRILKVIEDQAESIRGRGTATDEKFAKQNARPLAAIRQGLAMLRDKHPDTWSRRNAETIATRFGLQ